MKLLNFWPHLAGLVLVYSLTVPFSGQSLQKGQVIKQFATYSVAESLSQDAIGVFRTTIPCFGKTGWVHELPLFETIGALFIRTFPNWPAMPPLIGLGFAFLACLYFVSSIEGIDQHNRRKTIERLFWASGTLLSPIFLRYSIQFTPDLFASASLIVGAALLYKCRRVTAVMFFALAVAFKALFGAPALVLLFWDTFIRHSNQQNSLARRIAVAGTGSAIIVFPFALWSLSQGIFEATATSSAQVIFKSGAYLGPLNLLWDPKLYVRWFTWLFIKGSGPILSTLAIIGWVRTRPWRAAQCSPLESMLFWWFAGSIPFFLIIRQANIIHDYYCMGFAIPLTITGVLTGSRLLRGQNWRAALLWSVCVLWAVVGLASLRPIPIADGTKRPIFCGREMNLDPSKHSK